MSDRAQATGSVGLCSLLFLVFVVMRLTGHIDWAWYWIAAPLWIPATFVAIMIVLVGLAGAVVLALKKRE